ncbi:Cysteine desulfurase, partial [Operophtera brumata]
MGTLEDENQVLREKNTELVHKVQHWKMLAAQRDSEKLDLMKELNELRLNLARLRNNGNLEASKLDTALQSASEKALAHLVRASSEIAHTMDLAKAYMRERMDVDTEAPRWSAIGGTPKTDKIHRVRPIMMGGQFLQPIVALRRADTLLNTRPVARSPNQNTFVNERAVPIRMLQDVYIPLTRVDAGDLQNNNMAMEAEANSDSSEDLGLD